MNRNDNARVPLVVAGLVTVALVTTAERLGTAWLLGVLDLLEVRAFWAVVALISGLTFTLGVVGTVAIAIGEQSKRRVKSIWLSNWLSEGVAVVGIFAIAALVGGWLGWELSKGAWVQTQWWSVLMAPTLSFSLGATYAISCFAIARQSQLVQRGIGVLLITLGLGTVVKNIFSMQGTYPEYHWVVFLAAVSFVLAGSVLSLPRFRSGMKIRIVSTSTCIAILIASGWFWNGLDQVTRATLVLRSPTSANVIAQIYPETKTTFLAKTLRDLDPNSPPLDLEQGSFEATIQNENWNVLFIVVDTLRADVLYPLRDPNSNYITANDTPFLNEWLAGAVTFRHSYAQSSATHRSMPAMFQSLEVSQKANKVGVPIADEMAATGRTTFAVVNNFFFEPRYAITGRLLENFERVSVYEKKEQFDLVPMTLQEIKKSGGHPFFGWVHFYNMHEPGFDGKKQNPKIKLKQRYRRSLRWLDQEMKSIVDGLDKLGVAENTIVILTADHGEGLGDNNVRNHGSVYEEEIRVPISIKIPGVRGRVIEETVGNIDLLPTILDLVGADPNPQHRGRSLLKSINGKLPSRSYYMEDYKGKIHAVANQKQKLIYRAKSQVFHRFNLADDPKEEKNLYTGETIEDEFLRRELIRFNPKLIKKELDDIATAQLLVQRLGAIDADSPGEPIDFLLRLAASAPSVEIRSVAETKFREANSVVIKTKIYRHFCHGFPRLSQTVQSHFEAIKGEPRRRFLEAIAELRCPALDSEFVIKHASEETDLAWMKSWLELTGAWKKKPHKNFAPLWSSWIQNGPLLEDSQAVRALLSNIKTTQWKKTKPPLAVTNGVRALIGHNVPLVSKTAILTAATLKDKQSVPLLREILKNPNANIQSRQASIFAVSKLKPSDAVHLITMAANDDVLVLDAIKAMRRMGDPDGITFLNDVVKNHYNRIIRRMAKSAIKKIKKDIARDR